MKSACIGFLLMTAVTCWHCGGLDLPDSSGDEIDQAGQVSISTNVSFAVKACRCLDRAACQADDRCEAIPERVVPDACVGDERHFYTEGHCRYLGCRARHLECPEENGYCELDYGSCPLQSSFEPMDSKGCIVCGCLLPQIPPLPEWCQ